MFVVKFQFIVYFFTLFIILFSSSYASTSTELPTKNVTFVVEADTVEFSGATLSNNPGKPALPHYSITFLLPPNTDLSSVTATIVNVQDSLTDGGLFVNSAQPPTVRGEVFWPEDLAIVNGKDIAVYNTDAFYPESFLSKKSSGAMGDYILYEVEVYPYQYNPVTKELNKLIGGSLEIEYESKVSANSGVSHKINQSLKDAAKELAINYDDVATKYKEPFTINSTSKVFYIITTQEIVDASQELQAYIKSKTSKGFSVTVVTEHQWGSSANDLRSYLKNNYQSKNIEYVLLI